MRRYPMLIAQLPRVAIADAVVDGVPVPKGVRRCPSPSTLYYQLIKYN